jgi:hypothetical protein
MLPVSRCFDFFTPVELLLATEGCQSPFVFCIKIDILLYTERELYPNLFTTQLTPPHLTAVQGTNSAQ